jgi:hypothetical protein
VRPDVSLPSAMLNSRGQLPRNYATRPATGATAGATLMPIVMKAQITAAKADTIWVLAY